MGPPKPLDEATRVRALLGYNVLDTAPEPSFDRITALVSGVLDVPIALVSLIDDERQWFKSCVALGVGQTDRDVAFCAYAILEDTTLVIQTDIDVDLMTMLTERLRAAVEAITQPVKITASFGECHSSKTIEPTALLHHADQALCTAKREGRNRIVVT